MKLNKRITKIIEKLGQGQVAPVAYDTAFVAKVPKVGDLSSPAYPEALEWLRRNQNEDGSWGPTEPYYAHGATLETLAASLALRKWGRPDDERRFWRGMGALPKLAKHLANEPYESIGFELLLPTLAKDAESHGVTLPVEYRSYESAARQKRRLITAHQNKVGPETTATWWFSLELLGRDIQKLHRNMVAKNGSVAASPAAAAWYLSRLRERGNDNITIDSLLGGLSSKYRGGIPHLEKIDCFETAWVLSLLIEAGIEPTGKLLQPGIRTLQQLFDLKQGMGHFSEFVADPDDTAMGMLPLMATGHEFDADLILRHYNGSHFSTFAAERNASCSVNFHCLAVLKKMKPNTAIQNAIGTTLAWLREQKRDSGALWQDKWVYTPIYTIARAVEALRGLDDALAENAVNWLLENQREDGGWGAFQRSTAEETGYATLALCSWLRAGHRVPQDALRRAAAFLEQPEMQQPTDRLWIGKVLYCPVLVAEAVVVAAQCALVRAVSERDTIVRADTDVRLSALA